MTDQRNERPGVLLRTVRRLKGEWSERPWLDFVAAGIAISVHLIGSRWAPSLDVLGLVPADQRGDLYLATSTFVGLVNAFSLAALTFYRAGAGPRLRVVRRRAGDTLTLSWLVSIIGSLSVAALILVAGVLAHAGLFPVTRWFVLGGLWFVLVTGLRLMWVFVQITLIDDADSAAPVGQPAPQVRRTTRAAS